MNKNKIFYILLLVIFTVSMWLIIWFSILSLYWSIIHFTVAPELLFINTIYTVMSVMFCILSIMISLSLSFNLYKKTKKKQYLNKQDTHIENS